MTYNEAIEIAPANIGRTPCVNNDVVYALTQKGRVFICSPEDFDLVQDHKIAEDNGGYVRFGHNERLMKLLTNRLSPAGGYLDHEDRNRLNNLRENLRSATHQQNVWNQKHHTKGRFIGVRKVANFDRCHRYQADITANDKHISVGTFKAEDEAARARDRAAVHFHGKYAVLNFPLLREVYMVELGFFEIAPIQKIYQPGVVTHPMKYITKATHSHRWLVCVDAREGVIGRFSTVEEAQSFRDAYLANQ